ncbi:hypothetical protein BC830DRAFT_59600 [Chytriomyces sp. MP71]|nr:hypothetical protein BC830DRAFT_59600 [Chytriomyces sp. MP71]
MRPPQRAVAAPTSVGKAHSRHGSCFAPFRSPSLPSRGRHLRQHPVQTGGSQGLGRAVASTLAKAGAHLTIVARTEEALRSAADEIRTLNPSVLVQYACIDLADYNAVLAGLRNVVAKSGRVNWVVANAGSAQLGFLADHLDDNCAERMMNQNYYSSVNVVRALVAIAREGAAGKEIAGGPGWTVAGVSAAERALLPQKLIFVSSMGAIVSFIGYATYSASKCAQRGLADGLRSEFVPLGIDVHVYLPGNMDTPGYATENETKPEITRFIEGNSPILSPSEAARVLLAGVLNSRYLINNDLIGELIRVVANGVTPRPNPVSEALAAPLLFGIFSIWGVFFDADIRSHFEKEPKASLSSSTV